ncbi:MFS transporter, partial [Mesorhizobium sp.]|uniref:MFS transporter n=1 Tax=Mesorhizobium sp. TaxID=1871066 RepID=UPI00345AA126
VGRSLMMAASAMLTILMAFGIHDPWIILAFSFLRRLRHRAQRPSLASLDRRYLERRHLPAAITLLNVGFNTVRSVGPALGGIIVAAFGRLSPSRSPRSALLPLLPPCGATSGRSKAHRCRVKR